MREHRLVAANAIVARVCKHFGCSVEALVGPCRAAELVRARNLAAWLMRDDGLLLREIGQALRRDHTTVRVGIVKVEEERRKQRDTAGKIALLKGAAA
jgi:chromosomal replication initiator protein